MSSIALQALDHNQGIVYVFYLITRLSALCEPLLSQLIHIHIEGMEKLISSCYNGQTLPESYIFPLDARSRNLTTAPSRDNIPVIDLGGAEGGDQTYVVKHGILESLLNDTMGVFKEFFDLPAEDKANLYFDDPKKSCRHSTSSGYFDLEDVHLWRDYLRHPCHPLEECMQQWPQQPSRYRYQRYIDSCSENSIFLLLHICDIYIFISTKTNY
ncbi:unnamed protein product [Malus baccata var. baccata]